MFPKGRSSALVYGLNYKARALDAVLKTKKNSFLIGTLTLSEQNQIHHVEANEELTDVKRVAIYDHPHEIWSISCSPASSDLFFTIYNTVPEFKISLWKIGANHKLTEAGQLGAHNGQIYKVVWDPSHERRATSLDSTTIRQWDINTMQETMSIRGNELDKFTTACHKPYSPNQLLTACNDSIKVFDLTSQKEVMSIPNAHDVFVRDLDANPNSLYYFVTAGDDSRISFWDSRNPKTPVQSYTRHQHWVNCVKYNSYKDALVLSAGSCGVVNLWNMNSISFKNPSDEDSSKPVVEDHLIKAYADHEDSITSVAWSSPEANPWLFASLSYDGRVIINRVPDREVQALMD